MIKITDFTSMKPHESSSTVVNQCPSRVNYDTDIINKPVEIITVVEVSMTTDETMLEQLGLKRHVAMGVYKSSSSAIPHFAN